MAEVFTLKTVQDKLLCYVSENSLSVVSLGILLYLDRHDGHLLTKEQICTDLNIQPNTLRKHILQLEKLNMIKRIPDRRGTICTICPPELWNPTGGSLISSSPSLYIEEIREILTDISEIAGKRFSSSKAQIRTRIQEGFTVADFKKVHRKMAFWLDEDYMAPYFRPRTLYKSRSAFEGYIEFGAPTSRSKQTTTKWKDPEVQKRSAERRKKFEEKYSE